MVCFCNRPLSHGLMTAEYDLFSCPEQTVSKSDDTYWHQESFSIRSQYIWCLLSHFLKRQVVQQCKPHYLALDGQLKNPWAAGIYFERPCLQMSRRRTSVLEFLHLLFVVESTHYRCSDRLSLSHFNVISYTTD